MARVLKSNSSAPKILSIEIHEPREHNETVWQTKMHRIAIKFARTFVGQTIMMQSDKLLWTLEKTTTWISSGKTDMKKPVNLIRPLPWIFFLPTLIALRYTRIVLSLLSICLGYNEIEVPTMVTWLHQSRRTIRHIVHEAKQNKQLNAVQSQNIPIDYFKRAILSMLSNLSSLIFSTPYIIAMHNNKTSLNSASVDESTRQPNKQFNGTASNIDSEDGGDSEVSEEEEEEEDQVYRNFLSRVIESSDADDEDFVHKLNGDDYASDTNSRSSIATDDLSNNEIDIDRSIEAETSIASEPLNNESLSNISNTSAASNRSEKVEADKQNDAEMTPNAHGDNDALKQLIDDTTIHNNHRGENNKRHQKNGRSHAKAQNNGEPFNDQRGHMQKGDSKSASNHHVNTLHEFMVNETAHSE